MIIITADDFGRSEAETETAATLVQWGRVTSVSHMVFMRDSERAAGLATGMDIDIGLHLNFCERWTSDSVPKPLALQHDSLVAFFNRSHYAQVVYNPRLRQAFGAVYQAQVDEFQRLYRRPPSHIDGHHHLHLCANMVIDRVIPRGFSVRRNLTFAPGEKGLFNRAYRRFVDACLGRRYVLTDYLFSLQQCLNGQGRPMARVADLAKVANVEIVTHPQNPEEFDYLLGQQCVDVLGKVTKGTYSKLCQKRAERPLMFWTLLASLCECSLL